MKKFFKVMKGDKIAKMPQWRNGQMRSVDAVFISEEEAYAYAKICGGDVIESTEWTNAVLNTVMIAKGDYAANAAFIKECLAEGVFNENYEVVDDYVSGHQYTDWFLLLKNPQLLILDDYQVFYNAMAKIKNKEGIMGKDSDVFCAWAEVKGLGAYAEALSYSCWAQQSPQAPIGVKGHSNVRLLHTNKYSTLLVKTGEVYTSLWKLFGEAERGAITTAGLKKLGRVVDSLIGDGCDAENEAEKSCFWTAIGYLTKGGDLELSKETMEANGVEVVKDLDNNIFVVRYTYKGYQNRKVVIVSNGKTYNLANELTCHSKTEAVTVAETYLQVGENAEIREDICAVLWSTLMCDLDSNPSSYLNSDTLEAIKDHSKAVKARYAEGSVNGHYVHEYIAQPELLAQVLWNKIRKGEQFRASVAKTLQLADGELETVRQAFVKNGLGSVATLFDGFTKLLQKLGNSAKKDGKYKKPYNTLYWFCSTIRQLRAFTETPKAFVADCIFNAIKACDEEATRGARKINTGDWYRED